MKKKSENDFEMSLGCNFPPPNVHATAVTDYPVLRQALRDKIISCPVIVTDRALRKVRRQKFEILDVIPYLQVKSIHSSYGINSGHLAALYAAKHFYEVHLTGFDSVFRDDLTSSTDNFIPKNAKRLTETHKLHIVWRAYWNYIFRQHSNINFIFHDPEYHFESKTDKLLSSPERHRV